MYDSCESQEREFGDNKLAITVYPTSDTSTSEKYLLPAPNYNDWEYIPPYE